MYNPKAKLCLLVVGMHRSGTSSLAGGLAECGLLFGDNLLEPLKDNPKGFFEDKDILAFNDRLLHSLGGSWHQPYKVDFDHLLSRKTIDELKRILSETFYSYHVFGLKEPRISLLLPLYDVAFSELGWRVNYLIIHRNNYEIAQSMNKRGNMHVHVGLYLARIYKQKVNKFFRNQNRSCLTIQYSDYVQNPVSVFEMIDSHFPDVIDRSKFRDASRFVDKQLIHNRFKFHLKAVLNQVKSYLYGCYRLFIR